MLQTEAVEPGTLSLLKELMRVSALSDFYLVGGTALALRYGHRISIDLDLFASAEFERSHIEKDLIDAFGSRLVFEQTKKDWAIFCFIDDIKVDILSYPHPIISDKSVDAEIRMYGDMDLAAMKINAILGRGSQKDFYDIKVLLDHYPLQDCINAYHKKYTSQNLMISIPAALTYFDDADKSEEPKSLVNQSWADVKASIQQVVREYLS